MKGTTSMSVVMLDNKFEVVCPTCTCIFGNGGNESAAYYYCAGPYEKISVDHKGIVQDKKKNCVVMLPARMVDIVRAHAADAVETRKRKRESAGAGAGAGASDSAAKRLKSVKDMLDDDE